MADTNAVMVLLVGGGFTFLGVAVAEVVKRSGAIKVNKVDDRKAFTDTVLNQLKEERTNLEECDKDRRRLVRDSNKAINILEQIEFEAENVSEIVEEFVNGLEELGLKDHSLRLSRIAKRLIKLCKSVHEPDETIGGSDNG